MKTTAVLPVWTLAAPAIAWLLFAGAQFGLGGAFLLLVIFATYLFTTIAP